MSEQTLIAGCASPFRLVLLTYGMVPKVTPRICTNSFKDFFHTLFGLSFFQKDSLPWERFLSKVFFRLSVSAPLQQERTIGREGVEGDFTGPYSLARDGWSKEIWSKDERADQCSNSKSTRIKGTDVSDPSVTGVL